MRDLPGRNEFDAAFCFGNSFGYLDDDGNAEFLAHFRRGSDRTPSPPQRGLDLDSALTQAASDREG